MRKGRLLITHGAAGWSWCLRCSNGRMLALAPKCYTSKRNAVHAADEAMQMFSARTFVVQVVE